MKRALSAIHVLASWALVVGICVQAFLAGAALRNLGGSGDFSFHAEFGYTVVGVLALAVVLSAVASGAERRRSAVAFGLLLLYFVQTALPALRPAVPQLAALHVVNALLLFAAALWYAKWNTRLVRAGDRHAATATASK